MSCLSDNDNIQDNNNDERIEENNDFEEIVFVSQKNGQEGVFNDFYIGEIEQIDDGQKLSNIHIMFWLLLIKNDCLMINKFSNR